MVTAVEIRQKALEFALLVAKGESSAVLAYAKEVEDFLCSGALGAKSQKMYENRVVASEQPA